MKKNFKYILIFIFIVCLLIPISCLNLYAYTYDCYLSCSTNNSSTSFWYLYNYIWLKYIDYVVIDNVEYQKQYDGFIICQLIARTSNNSYEKYLAIYHLNGNNIGTRIAQIFDVKTTDTNYNYLDKIQVYYSGNNAYFYNQVFNSNATSTISGYGTQLTKNITYYCYNYNYFYSRLSRTYSGTYNFNIDIQFIENVPSTISFDKTYSLSFYNNDILYDSITISGASASGYAPFEEISQIKYGNTIVYDNSTWSSGYNSTLRYNQLMTQPNISTLNSDCNSIITFTTQYYVDTISFFKTYNVGTFYNDTGQSNEYSSITIIGKVANGTTTPFLEISQIKYDSTLVYDNNAWVTGYSNYLYINVGTTLSLNSINTDCNNIITFVNYYIDARIYNIGTFYLGDNSNTIYSTIQIKGSPNSNNTFSSIDIISYDSTIVYQNGSWVSGYSPNLKYFAYNDIDINQINIDCNNIIVFTKTQAESINPQLHNDLLGGVNVILFPITSLIEQANNNFVIAIVLMFLVVNFVVSIVFIFIKVKNK